MNSQHCLVTILQLFKSCLWSVKIHCNVWWESLAYSWNCLFAQVSQQPHTLRTRPEGVTPVILASGCPIRQVTASNTWRRPACTTTTTTTPLPFSHYPWTSWVPFTDLVTFLSRLRDILWQYWASGAPVTFLLRQYQSPSRVFVWITRRVKTWLMFTCTSFLSCFGQPVMAVSAW